MNSFSYPHHWQLPAATEKAAFEAVTLAGGLDQADYFGFAWATVIDGIRSRSPQVWEILSALANTADQLPKTPGRRRVTVAQHIHAMKFCGLFKALGITDLFWSHAALDLIEYEGIRIHPFPLYPAQAPTAEQRVSPHTPRQYLANFVGAYNPYIYLSNVRQVIFADAGKHEDVLIISRDAWHFDRTVYEEQISGLHPDQQRLHLEERMAREYVEAIQNSWFTLCPTGSGPNSIRIFECLSLGSIPIILTRNLRLPGPQDLWEEAAIIEEDSEQGYHRAIDAARKLGSVQRSRKLQSGRKLAGRIHPLKYDKLIQETLGTE